jgi:hypothetical protein
MHLSRDAHAMPPPAARQPRGLALDGTNTPQPLPAPTSGVAGGPRPGNDEPLTDADLCDYDHNERLPSVQPFVPRSVALGAGGSQQPRSYAAAATPITTPDASSAPDPVTQPVMATNPAPSGHKPVWDDETDGVLAFSHPADTLAADRAPFPAYECSPRSTRRH